MKTIVISAVNVRRGGTLRILRDCLSYASTLGMSGAYRIVAIVHNKDLALYDGIEYIELPHTIEGWRKRLWCEYVTMHKISKTLAPVYLWFSLHDTTPRVHAEHRAVYFQTSFPFMQLKHRDWKFDYKIGLFRLFTRFAYRINIHCNDHIVVQAQWLRQNFSKMFNIRPDKFIVAPPEEPSSTATETHGKSDLFKFVYVCGPDCHKNVELLCEAAACLEKEIGTDRFCVNLTIAGSENKYAQWLQSQWGSVKSINFLGYQSMDNVNRLYDDADCLVFPSRIETWGLPISEFKQYGKPMLLSDLPYAHEAAAGSTCTAFFDPYSPEALLMQMKKLIDGQCDFLQHIDTPVLDKPYAYSWNQIFDHLLK